MSGFQINRTTRIHDDPCDQAVQVKESQGPGSYFTTNLVPAASESASIAYQQPAMLGAAGYGWSIAQISADSMLRLHSQQTNSPSAPIRARVQSRPFLSVPFMGRGKGDAQLESQFQQPTWVRTDKSSGTISDAFYENQFIPMIPHVAQHVQNPAHIIQEDASKGWVRAGIPSRQWLRDQNC